MTSPFLDMGPPLIIPPFFLFFVGSLATPPPPPISPQFHAAVYKESAPYDSTFLIAEIFVTPPHEFFPSPLAGFSRSFLDAAGGGGGWHFGQLLWSFAPVDNGMVLVPFGLTSSLYSFHLSQNYKKSCPCDFSTAARFLPDFRVFLSFFFTRYRFGISYKCLFVFGLFEFRTLL